MATRFAAFEGGGPRPAKIDLRPTGVDRILAYASMILLGVVLIALWRGRHEWGEVPVLVWMHIVLITLAVGITPIMMLRRRGDRLHRLLGRVWVLGLAAAAASSFGIRGLNDGGFSPIHILSAGTMLVIPWIIWTARRGKIQQHRMAVRGMVTGALLITGFFTFPFDRLLGGWLLG